MKNYLFIVWCCCALFSMMQLDGQEITSLVNLDEGCFRCLCEAATGCDQSVGCVDGYCGPFKISRKYWKEAGEVTLPEDEKERPQAYVDCAISFHCAQRILTNYFINYAKDCNDDGEIDCLDYSMVHFNGERQCGEPLNRSEPGRAWLDRYQACMTRNGYTSSSRTKVSWNMR